MPDTEDIPAAADENPAEAAEETRAPKPEAGNGKPIRRLHIAANVAAQITLALVLFGMANYLNYRHHKRWDLSENKRYTLSEETAGFLGQLDKKVHITMAFLGSSRVHANLRALLEEYRRLSGSRISLDILDPARDRKRAMAITQKYDRDPFEESTLIVEVDGKQIDITESQMLDPSGRLFRGEDAITSALIAATQSRANKVYFVTGHGPLRQVNQRTALQELRDIAATQFFEVATLSLADVSDIPEDADAVMVVNASLDFSEREIGILRRFRDSDRGSLLFMLAPGGDTPQLHAFLGEYGITPQNDRVMSASGAGARNFDVEGIFLEGSPITSGLARSSTTFAGATCSLAVEENNEKLIGKGLGVTALVQAHPRFWGESNFRSPNPVLDDGDNAPPVYVAATAEQGATEDLRLRLETSRLVVIGNGSLLDPGTITRSNTRLVLGALNWIMNRENLIHIVPKTATSYQVEITPKQHGNMFTLSIFILPGIAFCIALLMWSTRRG